MKKRQTEEYEREIAEMEMECSIANTELMGRFRTAYNWIPDNITNYLDIGSSWDILRSLTYTNEFNMCIIATDTNLSKVAGNAKYYPEVNCICSDIQTAPFKDTSFDLITILDVLEHVDSEKKTIENIWRILRSEGVLILSVPHRGSFDFLDPDNLVFIRLYKILNRMRILNLNPYYLKTHKHYSIEDFKLLFGDKFEIVKAHRGGLILNPIVSLVSKLIVLIFINSPNFYIFQSRKS
jgi:SAM-dependent methyltransferase